MGRGFDPRPRTGRIRLAPRGSNPRWFRGVRRPTHRKRDRGGGDAGRRRRVYSGSWQPELGEMLLERGLVVQRDRDRLLCRRHVGGGRLEPARHVARRSERRSRIPRLPSRLLHVCCARLVRRMVPRRSNAPRGDDPRGGLLRLEPGTHALRVPALGQRRSSWTRRPRRPGARLLPDALSGVRGPGCR